MRVISVIVDELPETCEECGFLVLSGVNKIRCGLKKELLNCLFSARKGFAQPNPHNVIGCPLQLGGEKTGNSTDEG